MKNKKRLVVMTMLIALFTVVLTGCQDIQNWGTDFKESWSGLTMDIRTFDEKSQIIDHVSGKSVSIKRDKTFDSDNKEDSSVLLINVGGKTMQHVGSSLIAADYRLRDEFDSYAKKIDINNTDRSVPVINNMIHEMKNSFTGKKRVILIRSQQGYPLAVYAGDKVSVHKTEVPKSTNFLIDGKRLFVYRCDYTIYDLDLIN